MQRAISAYKHKTIARELSYIKLTLQINFGDPKYLDFCNLTLYILHSYDIISGHPLFFSSRVLVTVRNLVGVKCFVNFLILLQVKAMVSQVGGLHLVKATVKGDNTSLVN